ncbi:N-acetylmuramoyl-L-alanine amidase [Suttonella sp. R2A3]|uniref:N-acetylmuramoyl-L-alanine amidase n=1 Tax=Suttonella sp. R2A3 TaxID=2908648 RepID=UPI001F324F97|nr:N-acetylmuramoyl-L-alanine amidase [Suttonella sp. R2A3]UJF24925.1 N-acetylmuramoyl-L-alanine amidase [Suttonella sp. R2A3]
MMQRWRWFLVLITSLIVWSTAQAVTLENLRANRLPDKVQIVLDIDKPSEFMQFSLSSPPRIVLDFPNGKRTGRAGLQLDDGAVGRVRTGQRNEEMLRVVIDLNYVAKVNIYTAPPGGNRGHRIVVDVYDQNIQPALTLESLSGAQSPEVVFAGGPLPRVPGVPTQTPPAPNPPTPPQPEKPSVDQTAVMTVERSISPTGQVQEQKTLPTPVPFNKDIVVAIDPGHGGKDPGALSSATGLREKNVVLEIGKRLRRILNEKEGYRAVMTRDTDIYIPLYRRMTIAREKGADLFVSIHADAVEKGLPTGSSVYILSTRGASSQLAKYLANKENAVDLKWGVDVSKYDSDIQEALLNIQQEATLESSNILAEQTIRELARVGDVHKSNVERANFVVLRSPDIPSMLVETAFISTPAEARLLAQPAYQEKLANGIANGIEQYFKEHLPQHMLLGAQ